MQIAIPLFDQVTALDGIGPYEVLQRLPGAEVVFVADRRGEHRTDNGFLGLVADATYDEVAAPDVVVVPGGIGTRPVVDAPDHPLVDWVRTVHPGDPQPPFDAGSVAKAGDAVLARAVEYARTKR